MNGKEILAFGNRVDEFANMLGGDTRRPMKTGLINPGEAKSKEMMALALEEMCGKARKNAKICSVCVENIFKQLQENEDDS